MALNNLISKVWAARILDKLQKNLVFAQAGVVNRDYEGEIREAGDRVYVHSLGNVTIQNYTRYSTITYEELTDSRQELVIDQQKYFAFRIDDIDEAQAKPKVIDSASADAAYGLAEVADRHLAGRYTQAGTVQDNGAGASVQLTAANVYAQLIRAGVSLDNNNVPSEGRFAILPPWAAALLLENDPLLQADPQAALNGNVGRVAGFNILKSVNVPTTGTSPVVYHALIGHPMALSYAEQIVQLEGIRLQDTFADAVRGLHVYGSKVLRPAALIDFQIRQ